MTGRACSTDALADDQTRQARSEPDEGGSTDIQELRALLHRLANILENTSDDLNAATRSAIHDAMWATRRAIGLAQARAAALVVPPVRPAAQPARATVLVVDDNAGVRRLVVRQLTELGYRALEAEDGPSALMILNADAVDLLFTDVVMPGGMSGFDLARLVLSRWPAMKALITSGFPELEPEGSSASQAKLKRLIKPYRKNDLANALKEVLDG